MVGGGGSLGPAEWGLGVVRWRGLWAVGVVWATGAVWAAGFVSVSCLVWVFGCRLGVFGCRFGVVRRSLVGRWSVVGGLVVVVRCAGVVTLRHAVVILLLWELTLVSNKVNKRTVEFIGSVAELLSLPFCMPGDAEIECSIPVRRNTFIWAFTCRPVSPVIPVSPNKK